MDAIELLELIKRGESSLVQFKERVVKKDRSKSAYDLGTEIVAFLNAKGGTLVIGVNDETGDINGLTYKELQETNGLLANIAYDNVKPQVFISTETVNVDGENVIVVQVPESTSKPHTDNKGIIWMKNGSDKRRVSSREEMARLLQSSGSLYADETIISGSSISDIDEKIFEKFIKEKHKKTIAELSLSITKLLTNMAMLKDGNLTLACLLLFGKEPQKFRPTNTVHCIAFKGNDVQGTGFRSKKDPFTGNLKSVYDQTLSFIIQNLNEIQTEESFNSRGKLEVPFATIEELLVNALVHRDYFILSTIKVFIFDNRIEITSPGKLPNTLTVENIKMGTSIARNPILYSNSRYMLPFEGAGSGILRAIEQFPDLELINDTERELFISILKRNTTN